MHPFDAAWRQLSRALEPPEFEFRDGERLNMLKLSNWFDFLSKHFAPIGTPNITNPWVNGIQAAQ